MDVDVRIIVASNENLQEAYQKGKFREDLYHRFNEFSINLPPLRNRKGDIPLFAQFFLDRTNAELGKDIEGYEEDVEEMFLNYAWPGNLREFRNVVRRAVLLTPAGQKISANSLPWEMKQDNLSVSGGSVATTGHYQNFPSMPSTAGRETDLRDAALRAEYETIMSVLQQVNFNKKKAAELLKIDRKTLYNKIKAFQENL